jgi:WD40 repeat protein
VRPLPGSSLSPELDHWAPILLRTLQGIRLLRDVTTDRQIAAPTLRLEINRDAASRLGVATQAIDDTLHDAVPRQQSDSIIACPDGKTEGSAGRLATASGKDRTVRLWDKEGTPLDTFVIPTVSGGVQWRPDGQVLATLDQYGLKRSPFRLTIS